jgi:uncharacterized membrane protein
MRSDLLLRALALGSASGLRTMTGPAAAFRHSRWRLVLPLLALGEYVVDKLPQTPSRTAAAPLVARAIAGGLCGAFVALDEGVNPVAYAVAGSAAAIGAAYAGSAWRERFSASLPPVAAALLEDAAAIAIARVATRDAG